MDLMQVYAQARALKHAEEEADRIAAQSREKEVHTAWKHIADSIRGKLPIEGMRLFEVSPGQFNLYPAKDYGHTLDCYILPSGDFEEVQHKGDDPDMLGFIRVNVVWDTNENPIDWTIIEYKVVIDHQWRRFLKPHDAVIAAVEQAQKKGALKFPAMETSQTSPHPPAEIAQTPPTPLSKSPEFAEQ